MHVPKTERFSITSSSYVLDLRMKYSLNSDQYNQESSNSSAIRVPELPQLKRSGHNECTGRELVAPARFELRAIPRKVENNFANFCPLSASFVTSRTWK